MTRTAAPPAIELRGVSKHFRLESGEQVRAVDELSLTVPAGEFVCVLGPSGHGKSTILNLVAGFAEPSEGEILSAGKPVTGPGPDRGVVFQRDTLFLWRRVAENIAFGLRAKGLPKPERDEVVARYLRIIGMESYGRAWPKQLSGGMRRRVAIAAVFANEPEVLLMDEPFVGLDYARRATLHTVLLQLWERSRATVFFITHDVDEALALADRILVVVRGKIVMEERITQPRPRSVEDLGTAAVAELRTQILSLLELGAGSA
ncbi:MAG: transporter ATP-binding protein [Solirubrobacterales bacterium]|nr:transporter ATP-binding protein [Solirubrobacterales bacterium]